jgi:phosphatidylglycerophosphate synthase
VAQGLTEAADATKVAASADAAPKPRRRWLRKREESAFDRRFVAAARWLLARGVHPNHFTFAQLPVFAFTILAALEGWSWAFVGTIVFVIILDGGDGILARAGNLQSKTGAVLDALFDTLGIAVLVWGATKFFPAAEGWLLLLLVANLLLFLQNSLLDDKVVSYVRGPIVAAVGFPQILLGALLVASFTVTFLLLARLPRSVRAMRRLGLV